MLHEIQSRAMSHNYVALLGEALWRQRTWLMSVILSHYISVEQQLEKLSEHVSVSEELSLTEKHTLYLKSHLSFFTSLYFIYNIELTMPTQYMQQLSCIRKIWEREKKIKRGKGYKSREKQKYFENLRPPYILCIVSNDSNEVSQFMLPDKDRCAVWVLLLF